MSAQHRPGSFAFARFGDHLIFAGLIVAVGSIFSALPPLHFGIFFQSEPVVIFVHIGAGITALGLAFSLWRNGQNNRLVWHPFFIAPLFIALTTLVFSPFSNLPMVSWYGSPQLGEGLLLFLDMAIFVAGAFILRKQNASHFRWVIGTAIFVGIIACALRWLSQYFPGRIPVPYYFPDYLAFYGLLLGTLIVTAKPGPSRLKCFLQAAAAIVIGGSILLVSENRGAIIIGFVGIPILFILWLALKRIGWTSRKYALLLTISVPLAVTAAVVFFGSNVLGIQRGEPLFLLMESNQSRFHLYEVAWNAVLTDPMGLLIGKGWGSFTDNLSIFLPTQWADLRNEGTENIGTAWDAVGRVGFHTHNYLVEGFLSLGVLGLVSMLFLTAMVPLWAKRRYMFIAIAFSAAFGGTWALWFQMPSSIPIMAITWVSIATPIRLPLADRLSPKFTAGAFAVFGIALLLAGTDSWRFSKMAFSFQPQMEQVPNPSAVEKKCPVKFKDTGRGGDHLGFRLRLHVQNAQNNLVEGKKLDSARIEKLNGLICAVEAYTDGNPSFSLRLLGLLARADMAFINAPPILQPTKEALLSNWDERLNAVLNIAPNRTDLAATYLLWLLKENRLVEFSGFSAKLYAMNSSDPVGLWFSGIDLLGHQETAETGLSRMQTALKLGIERIIPVDDQLKQQLTAQ